MVFSVNAEVFSLWPFSKSQDNQGGTGSGPRYFKPYNLPTEPVTINGVDLELKMSLLDTDFLQYLSEIKKQYPGIKLSRNQTEALLEMKLKGGGRRRILLVKMDSKFPVIQFSLDLPEKMPKKFDWPPELPVPFGTDPVSCIVFPDRQSSFGKFKAPDRSENLFQVIRGQLESSGWKPVSGKTMEYGTYGGVFLKSPPLSFIVINLTDNEAGGCKGSIYLKQLKK
jgi:hypothetical protein